MSQQKRMQQMRSRMAVDGDLFYILPFWTLVSQHGHKRHGSKGSIRTVHRTAWPRARDLHVLTKYLRLHQGSYMYPSTEEPLPNAGEVLLAPRQRVRCAG